jgi:hypothetical protein
VQTVREHVHLSIGPGDELTIHPNVFSGFHVLSLPDGGSLVHITS